MSDKFHVAPSKEIKTKDEWLTPPSLLEALGEFDLDPCAPINPPWRTARLQYDVTQNGLSQIWSGRVWLNPPYGSEMYEWVNKLSQHKSGLALIFARTETKGFHREVWEKANSVFFFEGRIKFHHVTGEQSDNSAAPSCLISYSEEDTRLLDESIERCQTQVLKGKLVRM